MKRKIKKLLSNPNRFFFDYFAKRLGASVPAIGKTTATISGNEISLNSSKFTFDEKIHPWIQVATRFNLRTGATTGHPDQSMLINAVDSLDVLLYISWVAHCFKLSIRIYTLGGAINLTIPYKSIWQMQVVENAYKKIQNKPDFVIEFIGEFDNNFAAHFFVYDFSPEELILVRSNNAHVKKILPTQYINAYPAVINEFGNWAFGTPWPVDVIYTWVNKDDAEWIEMWRNTFPEQSINTDRYASKDELRYSLRALSKNMPWVHRIHVISNCAKPEWLKDNPKLKWVLHEEIFPDSSVLPVFNSHAIEACLHRVPNLSEHFIYFNDDMFVTRPSTYYDFFDDAGRSVVYLEPYGMVLKDNNFDITRDFLSPSINSQILLQKKFPLCKANRLHKHIPYALKKSIFEEIEALLPQDFDRTRAAKVRTAEDINLPSFLYHHYALSSGRAVLGDTLYMIVRPNNIKLLSGNGVIWAYKFLCFNDGDGSAENIKYLAAYKSVMNKALPSRGPFEIDYLSWCSVKISKTIMAYKTRMDRIPYIRSMIGDAAVSLDDGRWGLWENSKKSWLSYDQSSDYHMVIQDDAIIASNIYTKIFPHINNIKNRMAYSLFFRFKNRNTHGDFNRSAKKGVLAGGFSFDRLQFASGLIIPKEYIDKMIKFSEGLDPVRYRNIDDLRFSKFFSSINVNTFYTLPSLIEQDPDLDSVNGNIENRKRTATWFADGKNGFIDNEDYETSNLENKIPNILVFYWDGKPNFGDEIGPWLVEKITGQKVVSIRKLKDVTGLMTVGSIVQQLDRPGMTLWGSGIMRGYGKAKCAELAAMKPKAIKAVRGHLTRDFLRTKLGWDVPEVFGDPALLMPRFFNPPRLQYGVTLCPHYVHYDYFKTTHGETTEVIDVSTGVEAVVSKIAGSTAVLSTSLHGLIIAQAYGIPWIWLRVTDAHLHGGDFKFEDFFSILDRDAVAILDVTLEEMASLDLSVAAAMARVPNMDFDAEALLASFPKEFESLP